MSLNPYSSTPYCPSFQYDPYSYYPYSMDFNNRNFYYQDSRGSIYYKSEEGTCYDSENEICYINSDGNIYYLDSVENIYYKSADGTLYDAVGEVCYKDRDGRIYFLINSKNEFYKIKSPTQIEHNDQTYYTDSFGYFYTSIDGQTSYVENTSLEQMKFIPDCLRTNRAEGASPPYLSDHSLAFGRVVIPGFRELDFHVLNYGYWNVLSICCRINIKGATTSTKSINNPWNIISEPNYSERLNETIHKIISIIDNHENLGAFFLQEAARLNTNFFLEQLKERNWKLISNNKVSILYNEKILKYIENIPLNNIISKKKQNEIMSVFNWRTIIDRFLISGFCFLEKNIPVCKIHLSSFHLELSKKNISRTKTINFLFQSIIRGVGTITVFGGDTNQKHKESSSIFLGDSRKITSITKGAARKLFSVVGAPFPCNLSFEETAVSFFISPERQDVTINDQSTPLFLEPSRVFITRTSARDSFLSISFKNASIKLFKEMKIKLFQVEGKHFFLQVLNRGDRMQLNILLNDLKLPPDTCALYSSKAELVTIYFYDDQQANIFIKEAKTLIDHDLIYTKPVTKKNKTNPLTKLFFPSVFFFEFCVKLEISESTITEFFYQLKQAYNLEKEI